MVEVTRQEILVVEDDHGVAELLRRGLGSLGFAAHTESYGKTALSYAAEHRPDLVILDLKLPDLDGYQVCKELRQLYHRWDVPILMLTGMDQPSAQLRGFAHGADAYLTKPFDMMELLRTILLLLGQPTAP